MYDLCITHILIGAFDKVNFTRLTINIIILKRTLYKVDTNNTRCLKMIRLHCTIVVY